MKDTAEKVVEDHLREIVDSCKEIIKSAEDCIKEGDYFQCAVRLEMLKEHGTFESFVMRLLESLSKYKGL